MAEISFLPTCLEATELNNRALLLSDSTTFNIDRQLFRWAELMRQTQKHYKTTTKPLILYTNENFQFAQNSLFLWDKVHIILVLEGVVLV